MGLTYEAKYHQLKEQHWWFASRRDAVFSIISDLKLPLTAEVFEIGFREGHSRSVFTGGVIQMPWAST
jgi:hypothetical protein